MADEEHFQTGNINGSDVTIPVKPILGMRVYGATPGQALIVDPGGFVKGGTPPAPSTFINLTGTNAVTFASTAALPDYPSSDQVVLNQTILGPGKNLGNYGWTVTHGYNANVTSLTRGITQSYSGTVVKYATGDAANYFYVWSDGGVFQPADEGVSGLSCQANQNQGYFIGTIASTSGAGDTQPGLATSYPRKQTTDGGILVNISKGTLSGSLNGPSSLYSGPSFQIASVPTTGVTLPLTTALGVLSTALPYQTTSADVGTSTTVTVALQAIGGSTPPFVVGGHIWIVGAQRIEQSFITAVSAPSGGSQSITFKYRYPNTTALIFQGGTVGLYISLDANLSFSGIRSTYPAVGSLDGSTLVYAAYVAGAPGPRFIANGTGNEAATSSGAKAGFHLYPGAEVTANLSANANPSLEPNTVAWAVSDVVECPFPGYFGGSAIQIFKSQDSPADGSQSSNGITLGMQGHGITVGVKAFNIANGNPQSYYTLYGGPVTPPELMEVSGHFQSGIRWFRPPVQGMLDVDGVDPQQTMVNYLAYQKGTRLALDTTQNRTLFIGDGGATGNLKAGTVTTQVTTTDYALPSAAYGGSVGTAAVPYHDMYAYNGNFSNLTIGGVAGVTQNVAVGGSTLHITGGLITSVTTP